MMRLFRLGYASGFLAAGVVLGGMALSEPAWPGEAPKVDLLATSHDATQPSQPVCAATSDVRDELLKQYDETQRSIGLAKGGKSVLEIYSSPEGTWTAVITTPNGVTCILATGEYWMDVKQPVPGMGM